MRKCGPTSSVFWNTIYISQATHSTFMLCDHDGYLWVRHTWQPGILVQWHWLQVLQHKWFPTLINLEAMAPIHFTDVTKLLQSSLLVQWTILFNTISKDFPKGPPLHLFLYRCLLPANTDTKTDVIEVLCYLPPSSTFETLLCVSNLNSGHIHILNTKWKNPNCLDVYILRSFNDQAQHRVVLC